MKRVYEFSTREINGYACRQGYSLPFGARLVDNDIINFSISSKGATSCTLVLYHSGDKKPFVEIPIPQEYKIGHNYSIMVMGLNFEDLEYGYKFDGPYDPKNGYYFDKSKVLLDPCAKLVAGNEVWGKGKGLIDYRGRVILEDYEWGDDTPLNNSLEDLVIYEMHVRGFTKDESSQVKYKGTYAGIIEKIPYLKSLGVNCIELLPIFEYNEMENYREIGGRKLYNYWGYSTVSFYAPKAGLAKSGPLGMAADEVKNLVKKLHENGIEIILDVVFNHTAEGNENGPSISYKGMDNRMYYILTPDGYYYNFSGCGNTTNCNSPVFREHILDILRYWVTDYHIDGFRFDLASILSRDENGAPMSNPPILETLANDMILGKTKLIAEAWDADGLYQVGAFPNWGRWAEWNGKYRDSIRRFIKSDASAGPELIWRMQGSPDLYGNRGANASINFVTCHDGFTLKDMVSYNEKHNEANGEDNRDGCNDNNSWNCGAEGPTDNYDINALRLRQQKNAATILLLSRGVPMLLSGDEIGNSQGGNNNAYCQDNEISYINWKDYDENKDLFEYFARLIKLRNNHPVMRRTNFYTGNNSSDYPEMSFHGTTPWQIDTSAPFNTFGVMYAEPKADFKVKKDTFIYLAVNSYWEDSCFMLPVLPEGYKWNCYLYSGCTKVADCKKIQIQNNTITLMSRSSMILIGEK